MIESSSLSPISPSSASCLLWPFSTEETVSCIRLLQTSIIVHHYMVRKSSSVWNELYVVECGFKRARRHSGLPSTAAPLIHSAVAPILWACEGMSGRSAQHKHSSISDGSALGSRVWSSLVFLRTVPLYCLPRDRSATIE